MADEERSGRVYDSIVWRELPGRTVAEISYTEEQERGVDSCLVHTLVIPVAALGQVYTEFIEALTDFVDEGCKHNQRGAAGTKGENG